MRIIAGTARGRGIEAPPGLDTRPTLARVKEALFGSIQFDLPDSRVLDLFSGSGALGLEAASRGARLVILNDYDRNCAALIKKNAEKTQLTDRVTVWQYDYQEAIRRAKAQSLLFDIALIDAPYKAGMGEQAARLLFSEGLMAPEGIVMLEHARNLPPQPAPELYEVVWTRNYGDCSLSKLRGIDR